MDERAERPLPQPDLVTEPYWEAAKRGRLIAQYDRVAGRYRWPPSPYLGTGAGFDIEWRELSGRGTVYSYTIIHPPAPPAFDTPYVVTLVEAQESPEVRLVANIKDVDPEKLRIGMPVRVRFETVEDVALPYFVPAWMQMNERRL